MLRQKSHGIRLGSSGSLTCAVFKTFVAIACLLFDRELLLLSSEGFFAVEFCFSSNLQRKPR
jgi:hypothetical protein